MLNGSTLGPGERARVASRVRSLAGPDVLGDEPAGDDRPDGSAGLDDVDERDRSTRSGLRRRAPRRPGRRRWVVRVDPGRRAAGALGVAVVLAVLVTAVWVFASRSRAVPLATAGPSAGSPRSPAPVSSVSSVSSSSSVSASPVSVSATSAAAESVGGSPSIAAGLVVDVAGKVRRPGLYVLQAGARVADALTAAGGALPTVSLDQLNLASRLSDGEQILVGGPGGGSLVVGAPATGAAASGSSGPSGPVNLNTATLDELQTLPGIGPSLAQRIVDWRDAHGGFRAVTQLNDVSGIGDTRFAELRGLVTI